MRNRRASLGRGVDSRSPLIRAGGTRLSIVAALAVAAIGAGLWYFFSGSGADVGERPLLVEVSLGPYEHQVVEQGEVESSRNVELRCEVKARGSSGPSTTILEVVPEGTEVVPRGQKTKPDQVEVGDVLVRLDSSTLEQELIQQQIIVNTAGAEVNKAYNALETAKIAKKEYTEGTFKQEEQEILNAIYVAEENLRRAQETAQYSERLAARGYLTSLQLQGDRFAVDRFRNELDAAQSRLEVLRTYTQEKMLREFDSEIDSLEVEYANQQESYQLERDRLEDIRDQIAKCVIRAPEPGTVVYANVVSSRGNSEFVVEDGADVRERQVILRLPDPRHMQVKATISESRVTLVREGMPATVRIDALGDRQLLDGEVVRVNQYAEPTSWWSSTVKQYATYIRINDPPADIRPGLTAEVRIHVERVPEALQIPVQAVYENNNRTYCFVRTGQDRYERREIAIRSSNQKTVHIDDPYGALREGEQVVMNPRGFGHVLDLPSERPAQPGSEFSEEEQLAAAARSNGVEAQSGGESERSATPLRGGSIALDDPSGAAGSSSPIQPGGGGQ